MTRPHDDKAALPGTPYPPTLDLAAAMDVVNYVRGSVTDKARVTHSGWVVLGYGLSQWQPAPMSSAESLPPAPERVRQLQAADALEQAVVRHRAGSVEGIAIPWAIILPVLIQLVMDWLKPRTGEDPWERPPGEK
jgi:hypothetical protein